MVGSACTIAANGSAAQPKGVSRKPGGRGGPAVTAGTKVSTWVILVVLSTLPTWQEKVLGSEGNGQPRPNERGCLGAQYSSASMIVITRLVTDGSAGSGEWYVRLSS